MNFVVKEMNDSLARTILQWEYEEPYDIYNHELNPETMQELLGSHYFAVVDNEKLIGFFCIGKDAQVPAGSQFGAYDEYLLDIGLGMRPDLTGKGQGKVFFSFILNHVAKTTNVSSFRLTVATFNTRAIRLYEGLGFVKDMEFHNGNMEFMTMIKAK
jgi:ribosomal-protein-alanine N-acetyltransferase